MEADPVRWRAEELLAQADWLGALARRLVADPSGADDVVQETWVSALKHPPERERALRPWLAKVARNVARMQRRGEASRQRREGAAASRGEVATPDELVARLEGQRMLIDALARLAEPYRATVLLAYFEHLGSEEIARRQGVAASTVRWRLKLGLDALRDDLDRRQGGNRRAWALALAPLVRSDTQLALATSTALSWQGVLVMQTLLKVGAAAAAVVIAVAVLSLSGAVPWFTADDAPETPVAVTLRPIDATPKPSASDVEVAASARIPTEVALASPGDATPPAELPPSSCSIDARFVDRSAHPIALAQLRTRRQPQSEQLIAHAGDDGRARLAIAGDSWPRDLRLESVAPGYAAHVVALQVEAGSAVDLGDVLLEPGGDVSGRVTDAAGTPLEGVEVCSSKLEAPQSELERRRRFPLSTYDVAATLTSSDGSFVLEGASVGFVRLAAGNLDGWLTTFSAPIEVREGFVSEGVELVLEPADERDLIEGTVLDPSDRPLAWAYVDYRDASRRDGNLGSLRADEHGRFRVLLSERRAQHLRAYDPGEKLSGAEVADVQPGTRNVVLRLGERRELEIVARAITGDPIERYAARAFDPDYAPHVFDPDGGSTGSGPHAGGRSKLSPPTQRFMIIVDAPGHQIGRAGPFDRDAPSPLEFALERIATVRGQVVSGGAAVTNARICVFERDSQRHEKNGFPVAHVPHPLLQAAAEPDGRFELTLRERGDFVVRFEAEGFAARELALEDYDPHVGREGLRIELDQGGTIAGRVIAPHGREPTGTLVAFSRGDGFAFSRRVGADGAFEVERLTPGRWEVRRVDQEIHPERSAMRSWPRGKREELPWNCEVAAGRVTRFDLVLEGAREPAKLSGHVTVDGAAPGPWAAVLVAGPLGEKAQGSESTNLGPDGRFELSANRPGEAHLILTALSGELDGLRVIAPVTVADGTNEWSLELRTARVELENVRLENSSEPTLCVVSIGARGMFTARPVLTPGASQLVVPAGALKLWKYDEQELDLDPARWPALAEATVAPGEMATLRMP